MTESRDGQKLHFEHTRRVNGKATSQLKGEATLGDDGVGQSRFSEPEGQSVALPGRHAVPRGHARETLQHAKAGDMRLRRAVLLRREGEGAAVRSTW